MAHPLKIGFLLFIAEGRRCKIPQTLKRFNKLTSIKLILNLLKSLNEQRD